MIKKIEIKKMRLEKLPKVKPLLFAFIHKQEHLFFLC